MIAENEKMRCFTNLLLVRPVHFKTPLTDPYWLALRLSALADH